MLISERIQALKARAEEIDRDARRPNADHEAVRRAVIDHAAFAVTLAEDMATQPLSPFVGSPVAIAEVLP